MNTHIKTWLGTLIIIIMAITAGMFVWKVYEISNAPVSVPQTFKTPKPKVKENNVGIANPASIFCEENGGKSEIITATDGSQSGMCKFSDGSQCEEWAFQRGECKIGDSQKQVNTSDWQTYRNEKYGFEFKYPKDWITKWDSNNIIFNSPETEKNYNELIKNKIATEAPSDISISYYEKSKYLSKNGKNYKSLEESISNDYYITHFQSIEFAGEKAWFVKEESVSVVYAVFVEHNGTIFQINLYKDWLFGETDDFSSLSKISKNLLSTFKFTN